MFQGVLPADSVVSTPIPWRTVVPRNFKVLGAEEDIRAFPPRHRRVGRGQAVHAGQPGGAPVTQTPLIPQAVGRQPQAHLQRLDDLQVVIDAVEPGQGHVGEGARSAPEEIGDALCIQPRANPVPEGRVGEQGGEGRVHEDHHLFLALVLYPHGRRAPGQDGQQARQMLGDDVGPGLEIAEGPSGLRGLIQGRDAEAYPFGHGQRLFCQKGHFFGIVSVHGDREPVHAIRAGQGHLFRQEGHIELIVNPPGAAYIVGNLRPTVGFPVDDPVTITEDGRVRGDQDRASVHFPTPGPGVLAAFMARFGRGVGTPPGVEEGHHLRDQSGLSGLQRRLGRERAQVQGGRLVLPGDGELGHHRASLFDATGHGFDTHPGSLRARTFMAHFQDQRLTPT